jgi:hypothetical protein
VLLAGAEHARELLAGFSPPFADALEDGATTPKTARGDFSDLEKPPLVRRDLASLSNYAST